MSVASIPAGSDGMARRSRRRTARDQAWNEVPLRLYGLKRGTVGLVTALCALFGVFTLVPLVWLLINSTKNEQNLFGSFGFWFASPFELFHNIGLLFQNVDGDGRYMRWLANTALYTVVGGVGSTVLSALAGYGFARYKFRGGRALFYLIIAALLVPLTAVTLPLYFVYAKVGLINSVWGMFLPSMVSPVGVYLMRTFIRGSVPQELLDAARIDGAGEIRIFVRIALPLMVPGLMTVLLLSVVAVWNNYFLPLVIFSKQQLYPLTVGIGLWAQHGSVGGGAVPLFPLVVTGGLLTILPVIVLFLALQRYWRGGTLLGSLTG